MGNVNKICILPKLESLHVGGPASFQIRLIAGLQKQGIDVSHDPFDPDCEAILVIAGTRRIIDLLRVHRRGVRIVQRLNGMNWTHRKRRTGWRHYLRSEVNNWILATIRQRLADRIVYQSEFTHNWWETVYGATRVENWVIKNGVDLREYSPDGPHERPNDHIRLLVVEGKLGGGHDKEFENAVGLAQTLSRQVAQQVELMVVGYVPNKMRAYWSRQEGIWITWAGVVKADKIPKIYRSAHLLFPAELNPACPNSVVEALACGLPVVGYATGSLPELVAGDSGRIVPYGSNHWNFETPNVLALVAAARKILDAQPHFRHSARVHAEADFDVEKMVNKYINVLL